MVSFLFNVFLQCWFTFQRSCNDLGALGEVHNIIRIDFAAGDVSSIFPNIDKPQLSGFPT